MNESPKTKRGRKWFDGKDEENVVAKCKEVWAIGGTDAEACFYAEVSKDSISRYLIAHPELNDFRERLREKPILKARQTVVTSLGQPEHAKWYLERKRKDEFGRDESIDLSGKLHITIDV